LDEPGRLPVHPLQYRGHNERRIWFERLDALKAHEQWTGTTDHAKTIDANLDQFLATKKQQANSKQIAYGWYDVLSHHLEHFRKFAGAVGVENLNANLLANYHSHLLTEIQAGKITSTYAKGLLGSVKSFVRHLWEREVLESLPRNLNKLQIDADAPSINTLTPTEIRTLQDKATEKTRLYILLMLNTGMTGKDISDLDAKEVDWRAGRIIRKRSKTKREKSVPVVNYKLWPETFRLLKKYGNRKGEHVLLNSRGLPLRRWEEAPNGKTRNANGVLKAWQRLIDATGVRKPLKLLRKTSATALASHATYGQFAFLFLGHAPQTTAEKHYVRVPQDLFDEAITWLGQHFGIG
jgi:integrase